MWFSFHRLYYFHFLVLMVLLRAAQKEQRLDSVQYPKLKMWESSSVQHLGQNLPGNNRCDFYP